MNSDLYYVIFLFLPITSLSLSMKRPYSGLKTIVYMLTWSVGGENIVSLVFCCTSENCDCTQETKRECILHRKEFFKTSPFCKKTWLLTLRWLIFSSPANIKTKLSVIQKAVVWFSNDPNKLMNIPVIEFNIEWTKFFLLTIGLLFP